ncbi:hypothetical protein MCOR27_011267 [Pyricularia oryzae]|uniref:Uncharacterized protein n=5 Tax=Pyricularia TaxID=48558 RepID=A0ABQ8N3P1_PYRGI|nr:uncharacterized protein MGG_06184 [Pyricularia oryzae 70-15]ELQ42861.1 hypothetical protein OOU_Y34scaffold00192g47 [Pyricularia oryzae Y34]KAH8847512.1 hypothetical protein MCOR01_000935 [Pyricularia oryzae]KAI6290753.1 hypothetical protein MCOR33_011076 [Pyricularia grisea]EHA52261.1 hypothetical protein MGG_06184 [Pyricularia oryzae 70-15]KAH9427257.1 hypothetical protein MCOR02_012379 [Pyricularia oryzae]
MTQSDLDLLLDMGFDKSRAELAIKRTGGLQGALEWLEKNQDTSLEDLQDDADEEAQGGPNIAPVNDGQSANSLVCNECGKKFRNSDSATFHATKSGHTDFSESTEAIAHLTEEQKKERLAELREQLKAKKAAQSEADKEDAKRNEKIRQKATRETQDLKEEIARKEQIKEAAKKRQEKLDDLEAKRRIKAKIEADKAERKRKADEAKAARDGTTVASSSASPAPASSAPAAPKPSVSHNDARLRLQLPVGGNVQKTYPAETTLFEVAQAIEAEHGISVDNFSLTFPRKTFSGSEDFSKTLREAGLVPSAVLIVKSA